MAETKFTPEELNRFNLRIRECLEDPRCRFILKQFLQMQKKPLFNNALELWERAHTSQQWDEERMLDLIEDVDGFREHALLSINECSLKLEFTKNECCRILEKCLAAFMDYLSRKHKAGCCNNT